MPNLRWNKSIKLFCTLLILSFFLTGCWDRIEIEERAVVLGIAIDAESNEAVKEEDEITHIKPVNPVNQGMIRLTAQIAVPGRIPLGPGEGGGSGGAGNESVWLLDVVGHTVDDAVSNLQQKISGPLFFGHLRIIVLSEKFARRGLQNANDYFRRNPEIRRMTWMLVSKGKASDVMKATPELERVPTLYLMSTLDQAVKLGKLPDNQVGIFWSNLSKKGQEGFLPYIELQKSENILLKGMALFRGDKMVATSQPLDIGLYMAIKGMNPAGYQLFVEIPEHPRHYVIVNATQRRSKIDVSVQNGRPHFNIHIHIEMNLREKSDEEIYLTPAILGQLENELNKNASQSSEKLIKATQKLGSDIFGFGEIVRAKEAGFWNKNIVTGDKWQEIYRDATFHIDFQSNIRRKGMKAR